MASGYNLTLLQRCLNGWVKLWVRLGLPPRKYHLMTAQGRRTGRARTTPVAVLETGGERWLVCPYGERAWVKNLRASGRLRLSRGWRSESLEATEEQDAERKAPVLAAYVRGEPITRKYFRAGADSSLEEFAAEAASHPVFRLSKPGA